MSTSPAAFDGAAGHGQHVGLVQTAHAGDADGGQKGADGSGSQAHEQCHERGHGRGVDHVVKTGREAGVTIQGQRDQDKDDGEGHQEDLQSDLVRGLLRAAPSTIAIILSRKLWPGSLEML